METYLLTDKVALITGAGKGQGLATAEEFARRGAIVVSTDVDDDLLADGLKSVQAIDKRAVSYHLDVSKKDDWSNVVGEVMKEFGRIDILVNNAGYGQSKPFDKITEEEWDRLLDVNLKGAFFGCQIVGPIMREQQSGRIINFSSQAGKSGGILIGVHYSVSKAGMICMTKSIAAALAPYNVTVNAVAPGIVATDFLKSVPNPETMMSKIPLGRFAEPIEVARAVSFLASEDASYITGEILDINGGILMD
jgi:3-oxoacyl-[acyl-carrier protein] reductase